MSENIYFDNDLKLKYMVTYTSRFGDTESSGYNIHEYFNRALRDYNSKEKDREYWSVQLHQIRLLM